MERRNTTIHEKSSAFGKIVRGNLGKDEKRARLEKEIS
jgi:hypothetical protein